MISPRSLGRLLDALALFTSTVEEQERTLHLCPVCRRETGVEAHRPRCAYAAAKDALIVASVASTNRHDTVDERADAVRVVASSEPS